MAGNKGKQIVPYGTDLRNFERREEALALSVLPPREIVPTPAKDVALSGWNGSANPFMGRATFPGASTTSRPLPVPPISHVPRKYKIGGEKRPLYQLNPKPIMVGKDLDILPRKGETLINVATNKDGDTAYAT